MFSCIDVFIPSRHFLAEFMSLTTASPGMNYDDEDDADAELKLLFGPSLYPSMPPYFKLVYRFTRDNICFWLRKLLTKSITEQHILHLGSILSNSYLSPFN